jgi:uncharacterized integral membrane protein (TIGR00698 family)
MLGIFLVAVLATFATLLSKLSIFQDNNIGPLIIGIILGLIYAHTVSEKFPSSWKPGIVFSTKKLLRVAIIFYGFRLTFQDISDVGIPSVFISILIVVLTFLLALYVGTKVLKMDKEITILIGAGSAICGAAAVLATESIINAKPYKSAIAVATVVLFGTIGMCLYPYLFNIGFYPFTHTQMGISLGATVLEVGNVVAAGNMLSEEVAKYAVIEKMLRVFLLAPFLLVIAFTMVKATRNAVTGKKNKTKVQMPWFAFMFMVVVVFNSFNFLPLNAVDLINEIDTFLLTMAMTGLGIGTHINQFKKVGLKPLYLASILFIWLMFAGMAFVQVLIV